MEWFLPTPVPSLTIALSLISETTAFTVEGEEKARFTSTSAATAVFERPVASKDGMEDELAKMLVPHLKPLQCPKLTLLWTKLTRNMHMSQRENTQPMKLISIGRHFALEMTVRRKFLIKEKILVRKIEVYCS